MQVEHILPLKQDGSESMKREVDEPLKVLESGRDEQRRRPSTLLDKLRLKTYFDRTTIFLFKTNAELVIRKPLTWLLSTLDRS